MSSRAISINEELEIAPADVRFETSRSSGPGGQHVNKTESRVTLVFDLESAVSLDEATRGRLRDALAGRLSKQGELRVTSQAHRSQKANRDDAVERFAALLRDALEPRAERRPTRTPAAARRRRREAKRRRSMKKALRRPPHEEA